MSTENLEKLREALVEYLRLKGVRFVHRSRMDKATTANVGTPDLLFVAMGLYSKETAELVGYRARCIYPCAWEVKLPGRKPTTVQTATMAEMRQDGWQTAIITTLPEARAELARLGVITY